MTTAIGKDDFDFENVKYQPEISFPNTVPQVRADYMEAFMQHNTLAGRAIPAASMFPDPNHSTYVIDTCIRVKVPSDAFRDEKAKYWNEKHETAKKWAWIEGGVAALTVLGAVGIAAMEIMPVAAVAFGIASVATIFFCGRNISRASEASHQIEGWQASPLEKLANERAKAYQEGFPYVHRKDLKLQGSSHHQVLLPFEVQFLFERHFDNFYTELLPQHPSSEQGKKEWMDSFTNCNPVADKVLRYAHDGVVPEKYARVSYDYEVLHRQLTDMRSEFAELRNQSREKTTRIIKEINENRDLALLPFKGMLTYWTLQAKAERDEKLDKTTDPEKIKEIRREYSAAISKYNMYYAAAVIPINLAFDNQVSNAKQELKSILETIKKNEASSHAPYFNYAWGLLDYARQIKQVPTYVYRSQAPSPVQVFNIPVPSAPPVININFIQQAQSEKPQGIDESNYSDYLRFFKVNQEPQQELQQGRPLYPNLRNNS